MKDDRITAGETLEERLNSVEIYLNRMKKRSNPKASAIMPPVPIFWYCEEPDEDGVLMRYMFPSDGELKNAAVLSDLWETKSSSVELSADVVTQDTSFQKTFTIKPNVNIFDISMDVSAGSRFVLKLSDPNEQISGIWIAFSYLITPSKAKVYRALIDNLER